MMIASATHRDLSGHWQTLPSQVHVPPSPALNPPSKLLTRTRAAYRRPEPTGTVTSSCEVGPELAIYRSVTVTGCDEHRGRRGEQAAPFASAAFRQPFPAAISVALGPRSVGYRRTFAAARGAVLHAFAAPKFVELAPSPRNAETVGSASRDAKTVTMAHEPVSYTHLTLPTKA